MKSLAILWLSLFLISCSHADSSNQQKRENEISSVLTSMTLAIADDISQSRRLYISAYNNINSKSEFNNELFIYSVHKIDSLMGNYEIDNESFENDIKANKKITIEAIDGLCVMNKFIEKYSKFIDLEKVPSSLKDDFKKSLSFQPLYIERLKNEADPLTQLNCLTLK